MEWKVERGGHCRRMFVVDGQGGRVATMWGDTDCGEYNTDHAHLIAAAPELLDALRNAVDAMEAAGMSCHDERAAIAKAEGRT